ncbi:MAG: fumarate hydratase [Candidatus Marinimicrobia bacterium]|nr:fumarate hydratase [Candidatus Neomarinimicrobiota bacterium]
MRKINVSEIIPVVKKLCIDANLYVNKDIAEKIKESLDQETSPTARNILKLILKNHEMAEQEKMPLCQDTGIPIIFLEIGQDLHLSGGDLNAAINEGVRQGYKEGYLRKSLVDDPVLNRKNTGDNTPAIIYTDIVPGEQLRITIMPKGGGAENMSEVKMMKPADGIEGVKNFIVERIIRSGGNPCPPVIVGVGIGGSFEQSALLAKKALLRPLNKNNPDPVYAKVESDILRRINRSGVGPQGLGGRTTALAVQILQRPCHIASMPVAVNVECHCHRHKSVLI